MIRVATESVINIFRVSLSLVYYTWHFTQIYVKSGFSTLLSEALNMILSSESPDSEDLND